MDMFLINNLTGLEMQQMGRSDRERFLVSNRSNIQAVKDSKPYENNITARRPFALVMGSGLWFAPLLNFGISLHILLGSI